MSRSPHDAIPQRQLVYELKVAIDQAQAGFTARLRRVLAENPHSAYSTHVLHNLGATRREWLLARDAPSAMSPRRTTR